MVRASREPVRANDERKADDFHTHAGENERGARQGGREQDDGGENQPPTGEQ